MLSSIEQGDMVRPRHRSYVQIAIAVIIGLIAFAFLSPAANAETRPGLAHANKYCSTVIKKIHPGEPASRIVSQTCSSDANSPSLHPAYTVTLACFFEFQNYGGYSDCVQGSDGPCDTAGYGFPDMSGVEAAVNGIESYYYYNNCNQQALYTGSYYGGTVGWFYGDNADVPYPWANNIYSMLLRQYVV